ncbi:hypothetical protein EMIT0P201_10164 [Pseudomonas chlororaphis]
MLTTKSAVTLCSACEISMGLTTHTGAEQAASKKHTTPRIPLRKTLISPGMTHPILLIHQKTKSHLSDIVITQSQTRKLTNLFFVANFI